MFRIRLGEKQARKSLSAMAVPLVALLSLMADNSVRWSEMPLKIGEREESMEAKKRSGYF